MKRKIIFIISAVLTFVALTTVFLIFVFPGYYKTNRLHSKSNYYQISDESLGISFKITKDFERMGIDEVRAKNPAFIYGFRPLDVDNVTCFVSQTKRLKPGYVSPEDLKNGTFNQIKKSYLDAVLDNWEIIKMGKNIEGAKLYVSYKEGKVTFKQIEIVGTTDERTTFAFCSCPSSLYKFYRKDFEEFLNSLKIK